jgi:hypothetical protein
VMADEARPHFCVDPARPQSYREDLVGAIAHPSAVPPDAERCKRTLLEQGYQRLQQSIDLIAHIVVRLARSTSSHALWCRRHATSTLIVIGAPAQSRRASSALQRITNVCIELAGVPMEYVEHADPRPEPISIARCRELLGEDAESMTDQDIEDIRRHAETMTCIVVEMYQEQCRASE